MEAEPMGRVGLVGYEASGGRAERSEVTVGWVWEPICKLGNDARSMRDAASPRHDIS